MIFYIKKCTYKSFLVNFASGRLFRRLFNRKGGKSGQQRATHHLTDGRIKQCGESATENNRLNEN